MKTLNREDGENMNATTQMPSRITKRTRVRPCSAEGDAQQAMIVVMQLSTKEKL